MKNYRTNEKRLRHYFNESSLLKVGWLVVLLAFSFVFFYQLGA